MHVMAGERDAALKMLSKVPDVQRRFTSADVPKWPGTLEVGDIVDFGSTEQPQCLGT